MTAVSALLTVLALALAHERQIFAIYFFDFKKLRWDSDTKLHNTLAFACGLLSRVQLILEIYPLNVAK